MNPSKNHVTASHVEACQSTGNGPPAAPAIAGLGKLEARRTWADYVRARIAWERGRSEAVA